ncbi:HNH endonuclease [Alphaproteobacteria bacterium]|nr:HNH endonuclease [Alphaproteobacteria bacterium]
MAIGAHIQGLGRPHNGLDVIENMLCLCPNHHDQFDYRAFYIDPENLLIVGLPEFEKRKLNKSPRHNIGGDFLRYQQKLYYQNVNK